LKVASNNPGIIDLIEQGALNPNVRVLSLVGKKAGTTMVEARAKTGSVWAYVQVQVLGDLSREERVGEAIRRAIPLLPGELKDALEAMISPESLMIIAASLLLWAGSHAFGVGEIVDIVLMVGGFLMLGKSVFDLGEDLFKFAKLTVGGSTDSELDQAAKCFARVVVIGFKYMRQFRARLKASAYWRSALLRYLEEALVEGFGQFKVNGLLPALKAVTFPIGPAPYGYVTISQLATEGTALGTIVVGGMYMKVVLSKTPHTACPRPPSNDRTRSPGFRPQRRRSGRVALPGARLDRLSTALVRAGRRVDHSHAYEQHERAGRDHDR